MAEFLEGTIERITYQGDDTGYTIARLQSKDRRDELVTVVGAMASVQPGESVRLQGDWSTHPKYGRQFKFTRYTTVYPATLEGIRKYMGSGLIKGIGPVTAKRIVAHFGLETLDIIEQDPDRLLEVPGTGPKRVEVIKAGWEEQRAIKDVMLFLQSHGVSTGYAVKIYKKYGDEAVELVRQNPYRLEREIWGIGFLSADRIARSLGVAADAPERLQAGLRYALNQASDEGHVFLPQEELVVAAQKELEVDAGLLAPQLAALAEDGGAMVDEGRAYLPPLYYAEVGATESLQRLLREGGEEQGEDADKLDEVLAVLEGKAGIEYEETQKSAIRMAADHKVMVLTGGPGTGKTTITQGIIGLLEQQGLRVVLCSPTGRAAKKLSEATQRPARTIHRLLGFKPPEGFEYNRDNPLKTDAVVVDEVSMIDTALLNSLLKAVPTSARLVLVGDVDQLPSVGAGSVLRDLIVCGALPVVRLTHIFRQAQESQIIINAHKVNQGRFPHIDNRKAQDFFFIQEEEPERIVALIQDLCTRRLPQRYELDPVEDIQVLTPMYRSLTGAHNLNQVLQQALNPEAPRWKRGHTEYRVGDKVMQIRNNYDKTVFNGDVGRIQSLDAEEQKLVVLFEEEVEYDFGELDELVLAYACSVHKSQGSEYPVVVMPVSTQHYMMLQRNLLYTGITRARQMVVLVGTKQALALAVRNAQITERYTGLADRLRQGAEEAG
ncbi:MAG: ATP-dependent RecD-like DNA helicase [Candidatus Latescibacteria bacterium]|nr:ATP-dependent RecD-like DNA helicase [Candidatus Latescibacterota bacterium]